MTRKPSFQIERDVTTIWVEGGYKEDGSVSKRETKHNKTKLLIELTLLVWYTCLESYCPTQNSRD